MLIIPSGNTICIPSFTFTLFTNRLDMYKQCPIVPESTIAWFSDPCATIYLNTHAYLEVEPNFLF